MPTFQQMPTQQIPTQQIQQQPQYTMSAGPQQQPQQMYQPPPPPPAAPHQPAVRFDFWIFRL